jgi:hypothetical protein
MTPAPQHRGRVVWRLALGLLLAIGLLGMSQRSISAAPSHVVHATHAMSDNGYVQADYGRWHASLQVSNCSWGEGTLSCDVNGRCWVDGLGLPVDFTTKYVIQCRMFRKPSNAGWFQVSYGDSVYTQGIFDPPPTGRVAGVDFPTYTGVGGDTWDVEVNYGVVCSLYQGKCVTRYQEWDDTPPSNSGLYVQWWLG